MPGVTALRAGWRTFWARPDATLIPVAAAALVWIVAEFLVQATISGTVTRSHSCLRHVAGLVVESRCAAGAHAHSLGVAIGLFAYVVLGLIFWAVLVRAGLAVLGTPVRLRPAPILGAAVLGAIAITPGLAYGVIGGLVIAFAGQFTMIAILLEDRSPLPAFVRSARLAFGNPGRTLGFSVLATLVLVAGLFLGLVGLLPATALVLLAQLHLHRDRAESRA
jgi:hypothetical protein